MKIVPKNKPLHSNNKDMNTVSSKRNPAAMPIFIFILVFSASLSYGYYLNDPFENYFRSDRHPSLETIDEVGSFVESHTEPDEEIFAWPTYSFASNRRIVLNITHPLGLELNSSQLIENLSAKKIRYVVVDPNLNLLVEDPYYYELKEYIYSRYVPVFEYNHVKVMELRGAEYPRIENDEVQFYHYSEDVKAVVLVGDFNDWYAPVESGWAFEGPNSRNEFYFNTSFYAGRQQYSFHVYVGDALNPNNITDPLNRRDDVSSMNVPLENATAEPVSHAKQRSMGEPAKITGILSYKDVSNSVLFVQGSMSGMPVSMNSDFDYSNINVGSELTVSGIVGETLEMKALVPVEDGIDTGGSISEPVAKRMEITDESIIYYNADENPNVGTLIQVNGKITEFDKDNGLVNVENKVFAYVPYDKDLYDKLDYSYGELVQLVGIGASSEYIQNSMENDTVDPPNIKNRFYIISRESQDASIINTSLKTIVEARNLPLYSYTEIQGIVSMPPLNFSHGVLIFVQDSTGGIAVYSPDNTGFVGIKRGMRVELMGSVYVFNGLTQINLTDDIEILGAGETTYVHVGISDIGEGTEGQYVQTVTTLEEDEISYYYQLVHNDVRVRLFVHPLGDIPESIIESYIGYDVRVRGIVSQYDQELPYESEYEIVVWEVGQVVLI